MPAYLRDHSSGWARPFRGTSDAPRALIRILRFHQHDSTIGSQLAQKSLRPPRGSRKLNVAPIDGGQSSESRTAPGRRSDRKLSVPLGIVLPRVSMLRLEPGHPLTRPSECAPPSTMWHIAAPVTKRPAEHNAARHPRKRRVAAFVGSAERGTQLFSTFPFGRACLLQLLSFHEPMHRSKAILNI